MRISSKLSWIALISSGLGLLYPIFLLLGAVLFIISAVIRNKQIDNTWNKLDKILEKK